MSKGMKFLGLLLTAIPFAAVDAAEWAMDPGNSLLTFVATYEGQPVTGIFHEFKMDFTFDAQHPEEGKLTVTISTNRSDMHSDDINEAIKGPQWFATEQYPQAKFTSERISQTAPDHFVATGTLSLKGVSRIVQVPFTWNRSDDKAIMAGMLTVLRTDFNIGTGEWSAGRPIGREIEISFRVNLKKESGE